MNQRGSTTKAELPRGTSCFPFVSTTPSSLATPRSNAAVGPESEDSERNEPSSEAPSDLASWENPDLNIFAPAVPPEQNRPQDPLEGRNLFVNDDDSEISTLTSGEGVISLSSSVLNPGKRVIPVIAKPMEMDGLSGNEYSPESAGRAFVCLSDIPKWVKWLLIIIALILVVGIAALGISAATGAFGAGSSDATSTPSDNGGTPTDTVTVSVIPTLPPSSVGVTSPTVTFAPTQKPSTTNSIGGPTPSPTSAGPTPHPTNIFSTAIPTSDKPEVPTPQTAGPTQWPTLASTVSSTEEPTQLSTEAPQPTAPQPTITKFFVMGSHVNDKNLEEDLSQIPSDFDWVIHLGDFSKGDDCSTETYENFDQMMSQSSVPVFMLPGETEWNNCLEPELAWERWTGVFSGYNTKHWSQPTGYSVSRQSSSTAHVEENFAFPYKGVLHVGINLVGGAVHDSAEWDGRLDSNLEWINENIKAHRDEIRLVLVYGNSGFENEDGRLRQWYQKLELLTRDSSLAIFVIYETQSVDSASLTTERASFTILKFKGGFWPPLRVTIDTGGSSWDLDFRWY